MLFSDFFLRGRRYLRHPHHALHQPHPPHLSPCGRLTRLPCRPIVSSFDVALGESGGQNTAMSRPVSVMGNGQQLGRFTLSCPRHAPTNLRGQGQAWPLQNTSLVKYTILDAVYVRSSPLLQGVSELISPSWREALQRRGQALVEELDYKHGSRLCRNLFEYIFQLVSARVDHGYQCKDS